jgi:N-formylglutamate amidohydrolase
MMFMITVPHSGETLPAEANWLQGIDPLTLLTDVDRFVDQLYAPGAKKLGIPMVMMETHRYVIDLNRLPTDIDPSSVVGAPISDKKNSFVSGYHWTKTTHGQVLMTHPISMDLHHELTRRYYEPFHEKVRKIDQKTPRFHIDAHSMPSVGTSAHKDGGQKRPDIVVSDCSGKSCAPFYKDIVIAAYEKQGFTVAYNWPYLGGRMTEQYGRPTENRHSVQVELKRSLYMDEKTKEKTASFDDVTSRLSAVLKEIQEACTSAHNSKHA